MSNSFHILFLARSGSHMLVNALNHHPELDVSHVDGGHSGKGYIKGHATPKYMAGADKAIILTRNGRDRLLSYRTDLAFNGDKAYHTTVPVKVRRTNDKITNRNIQRQKERDERLQRDSEKYKEKLYISYEELTGNKDIREIPDKYVFLICNFLGIEHYPMKTDYYKPEVINA